MSSSPEDFTGRADTGLLLVGHGSREQVGIDEFLSTARLTQARGEGWAVEPCFLEFARPTIAEGFARLMERGARRIVVAPVMLFAARHIRRDIPAAVAAVASGYAEVAVEQAEHLGCHEAIVELSRLRCDAALAARVPVRPEKSALVVVGRGSHDAEATDEMWHFVRLRQAGARVAQTRTAFLAMADPPLAEVLEEVAKTRPKRIIVQPHLLFGGVLAARIGTIADRKAAEHPHIEWLVSGHLGPAELVVKAILDRAAAVLPTLTHPRP